MSNSKKTAVRQAAAASDANPVQAGPVQPAAVHPEPTDSELSLVEVAALVGIELVDVLAWRCYDGRIVVVVTRWGAKLVGDLEA
ncbi:hypothetical protein CK623_11440 [Vandammella animalimorsus]|uniref:Uncharacterized protein n=1 Tax=Vandammella animalimorsus TaxID=2029117 RepID=A0A2A2AN20_9BURK|nr:hypothetical protein [Vandammella animalimorsus]PAT39167.1 hypothetical protein CK623_11440 [Vandammella animalimorsus]